MAMTPNRTYSDRSIAIIGGGVAGLVAAYELSKAGHKVTLYEREPVLGGLASSFVQGEAKLERFYHFVCRPDKEYVALLKELRLISHLRWRRTRMGQFYSGHLYPFGAPWDLLTFPFFCWRDKLKFAWGIMRCKSQGNTGWARIADLAATRWLVDTFGQRAYDVVHGPLIRLKFGDYAPRLSAAWMWARIHRVGKSRGKFSQLEISGYLDQGTQILIDELERRVWEAGGVVKKNAEVQRIMVDSGIVQGIVLDSEFVRHDVVISTAPSPLLKHLLEGVSNPYLDKLGQVDSIGVRCLVLILRRSLSPYFWINVSDPAISLAGIIEYTNLNPRPDLGGEHIVYLPQYLPSTSPAYTASREVVLTEYVGYLRQVIPGFEQSWIKDSYLFTSRYAQPVCEVGFSHLIPPIETPIVGLYVTDSCQLHPDDRAVSNSIGLGKKVADSVAQHLATKGISTG